MTAPAPDQDGFQVDPDVIGARITQLDGLAGRVQDAEDGAFPVDPWSYGLIGMGFGLLAQTAAADAKAAIGDLSTATADATQTLRAVQAAYLTVEGIMSARFRELGL